LIEVKILNNHDIIKNLLKISYISTIRCIPYLTTKRFTHFVWIYPRVSIGFGKNIEIINNGFLLLGISFDKCNYQFSTLKIDDYGKLIIKGNFTINTGCFVSIAKNATLELGSGYINNNVNISCYSELRAPHPKGWGFQ
jgi:hypothetical protein